MARLAAHLMELSCTQPLNSTTTATTTVAMGHKSARGLPAQRSAETSTFGATPDLVANDGPNSGKDDATEIEGNNGDIWDLN